MSTVGDGRDLILIPDRTIVHLYASHIFGWRSFSFVRLGFTEPIPQSAAFPFQVGFAKNPLYPSHPVPDYPPIILRDRQKPSVGVVGHDGFVYRAVADKKTFHLFHYSRSIEKEHGIREADMKLSFKGMILHSMT